MLDGLARSADTRALLAAVVALTSPIIGRRTSFDFVSTVLFGVYVLATALDSIASGR